MVSISLLFIDPSASKASRTNTATFSGFLKHSITLGYYNRSSLGCMREPSLESYIGDYLSYLFFDRWLV